MDRDDLAAMLDQLQQADVSAEAGVIALASRLPPGYIFAVLRGTRASSNAGRAATAP